MTDPSERSRPFELKITVAAIAAFTVYAKQLAMRLAAGNASWIDKAGFALRMGGGGVITILGTILFLGSLGQTNTML